MRRTATGALIEVLILVHATRKLFVLADIAAKTKTVRQISPLAFEAVMRIDALCDIERPDPCR